MSFRISSKVFEKIAFIPWGSFTKNLENPNIFIANFENRFRKQIQITTILQKLDAKSQVFLEKFRKTSLISRRFHPLLLSVSPFIWHIFA